MPRSDFENGYDVVVAVDDDDLVVVDEVHEAAPFRVNVDNHGRDFDDANAGRYCRADADREVDVGHARSRANDGLANSGLLLGGECGAAASAFGTLRGALSTTAFTFSRLGRAF